MRITKVLRKVLGLCRAVVICGWEIDDGTEGARPKVVVRVRLRAGRRARCGRCEEVAPLYDRGWGERRWRLTNGIAESNNASIGKLRTNARGFHDPKNFITMIMLDRAGLCPDLPWSAAS